MNSPNQEWSLDRTACGVVNVNDGSGTRQPGPYVAASSASASTGTGNSRPRAESVPSRDEVEGFVADLEAEVGAPLRAEGGEDVDVVVERAVEVEAHLEVPAAVPQDRVPPLAEGPLDRQALQRHVGRVLVRGQVGQVGVVVVRDQLPVPDQTEEGPVADEGVDTGRAEVLEQAVHAAQQTLVHGTGVHPVEARREATPLVHRQPATARVAQVERAGLPVKATSACRATRPRPRRGR